MKIIPSCCLVIFEDEKFIICMFSIVRGGLMTPVSLSHLDGLLHRS